METRDLAIKYKDLHQVVELMISNVREIGFDVSEYEKKLQNITEMVNKNVKESYSKEFARANYEMDYLSGIAELNKLKVRLEKYEVYFKVLNSCEWLNIRIAEENITIQQLKEYVSEMAFNLKQIVKSDTIDYDNEKNIVEMVYLTAYNLIKLELMITGNSQLYEYIKKENVNISYFNIIIKREVLELDLNDENNKFLKQKLLEIRKNNINSNYFDLDLIKGLLIHNGNDRLKHAINDNLNALVNKINSNTNEINKLMEKTINDINKKDNCNNKIKQGRKKIKDRILSMLLALIFIAGGTFCIFKSVKKSNTLDKYFKKTEIYSTITNETTTETTEVFSSETPQEEAFVRVYEPYENDNVREYQYYDVSYLDFDSAYKYYEYGVDNYEVTANDGVLKVDNDDHVKDYQDSYTEVVKVTYDYEGVSLDVDSFIKDLITVYSMHILFLFQFSELYKSITEPKYNLIIIGGIREIYDETLSLLNNKEKHNNYREMVEINISKMMELISKSDELNNEFRRLYNANRYLLDNPEELYNMFLEMNNKNQIENAKRLVKENKNKR